MREVSFIHKQTGYKISLLDIIEALNGTSKEFSLYHYEPFCERTSLEELAKRYTYYYSEIPYSNDFKVELEETDDDFTIEEYSIILTAVINHNMHYDDKMMDLIKKIEAKKLELYKKER